MDVFKGGKHRMLVSVVYTEVKCGRHITDSGRYPEHPDYARLIGSWCEQVFYFNASHGNTNLEGRVTMNRYPNLVGV